ncbi:biliverdin-producing heme oxygenase [Streptosporangium sandarakinum]|uniref:biliverdin-producing heme oxygenase n=1 Tax=Streptosporangium sandarakinum TaxID=1260955 RepID=UPI003697F415
MSQAPFSEVLRNATRDDHAAAENQDYLVALLAGRLSPEGYGAMVAQNHFVYTALDRVSRTLADDPVAAPFVLPELYRGEALARDLETVYGPGWRSVIEPSAPTLALVARIEHVAAWPGGYVAHHYTRYLGDLSGGQFIRRELRRIYGYGPDGGADSYRFDAIGSIPRFRREYRARLDALPADEDERRRIVQEARLAFRLTTEVLADLGRTVRAEPAA